MKLISVKLTEFKRMAVTGFRYIELTPQNMCQVILGTNGSGKSSLLRELSPLAADPAAYGKNGCKDITYEHNGSVYRLVSFLNPTSHYFYKDGVAIKLACNAKVQNTTVEEHFGYTAQIDELIKNRVKFTAMGTQQRREWFTLMSNIDYSYALGLYRAAKDNARDIAGALKIAKKNLVVETGKVLSKQEYDKLESEVEDLHKLLSRLFEHRSRIEVSSTDVMGKLKASFNFLSELSEQVLRNRPTAPEGYHYPDYISLNKACEEFSIRIRETQSLIASKAQDLNEMQKNTSIVADTEGQSSDSLRLHRDTLQLELAQARKLLIGEYGNEEQINAAAGSTRALEGIYEELIEVFTNMPTNEDLFYSTAKRGEITQSLNTAILTVKELSTEKAKYESIRAHHEYHKSNGSTSCPKCNHVWIAGFSQVKYDESVSKCAELTIGLEDLSNKVKKLEEQQLSINEFIQNYMSYRRIKSSAPALAHIWNKLDNENLSFIKPQECISILSAYYRDIPNLRVIEHKTTELHKASILLDAFEKADMLEIRGIQARMIVIEKEIEKLTQEQLKLQLSRNDHLQYQSAVYQKLELGKRIGEVAMDITTGIDAYHETIGQEAIQSSIVSVQSILTSKELALNSFNNQRGKVEELENQIQELEDDEKAAKLIAKELSPNEGIIADSLLMFINGFIDQMNVIIAMAWSYMLVIKPCELDEDGDADLSYRFPMCVNSEYNEIDDVKNGSNGIREIIDLAYMVAAMLNLGLSKFPLHLDEFGATFDDYHRVQAGVVIKNIQEQMQFEQLFLVTHHESSYGALTNADIIVISEANVKVSGKYNENVVLKHIPPALPVLM